MENLDDDFEMPEPEDLHPDLARYKIEARRFPIPIILHPLMTVLIYHPAFNKLYNYEYQSKLARYNKLLDEQDYQCCIWAHESNHRPAALAGFSAKLEPCDYWSILRDIWDGFSDSDRRNNIWISLWSADFPERHCAMNNEEMRFFDDLPESILAYSRATHAKNRLGWRLNKPDSAKQPSWSTGTMKTFVATIGKSHILACLSDEEGWLLIARPNVSEMRILPEDDACI